MKVLELFAGTRSIGKAFERRGHEVYSIEWDKDFDHIDWYADIMTVTVQDILDRFGRPDVIWASKDGRLVVSPCKVGDVVYGFHGGKTILPMVVKWIETYTNGWCIAVQYAQMAPRFYRFSDFGKTVSLTREEAEKALEAMKDE